MHHSNVYLKKSPAAYLPVTRTEKVKQDITVCPNVAVRCVGEFPGISRCSVRCAKGILILS